jgi:RimJ/RimL family protein N-acetyltransferase
VELLEDLEVAALAEEGPVVLASLAEWEAWFEQRAANPPKDRISFAVESEGELIGQAELHHIDHFNQRCELGIALGEDYWGRGLGQEATRLLVGYAFTYLNMNRVSLRVLRTMLERSAPIAKPAFEKRGGCVRLRGSPAISTTNS